MPFVCPLRDADLAWGYIINGAGTVNLGIDCPIGFAGKTGDAKLEPCFLPPLHARHLPTSGFAAERNLVVESKSS